MGSQDQRLIREYFDKFEGILDKSGIIKDRQALKKNFAARSISAGGFSRIGDPPQGISLINGGFLSFIELVEVISGKLTRIQYTYRYVSENQDFVFRYDKDPRSKGTNYIKNSKGQEEWHPECHLHYLDSEKPRYKTHETSLDEILEFVKYCFV